MKTLYTAHATAIGGRDGRVATDDGRLELELARPGSSGQSGKATNPEQLFACGYAACFGSAVQAVAKQQGRDASAAQVTAHVQLLQEEAGGYRIGVELEVAIDGMERTDAQALIEAAHQMCPYSKALRDGVEVAVRLAA